MTLPTPPTGSEAAPSAAAGPTVVALLGPESTGKSTLSRILAEHFGTIHVEEYARDLYDWSDPDLEFTLDGIVEIAEGQARLIREALPRAHRVLFADTDVITTLVWSEIYFGSCPEPVHRLAAEQDFGLYLLLDHDVPWVDDGVRTWEHLRAWHFHRLEDELRARGLPYEVIAGDWETRVRCSRSAVERLLRRR